MAKRKSLLLGILVGSTVGATITLLSAPSSGKQLRHNIKLQGIEWKTTLEKMKEESLRLKNQIVQTSKEGAVLMKDLTRDMKNSVVEWRKTVEPHQENIYEYLEQIESSLKALEEKVQKKS
ncbi:MAG TPA: YtxH domain-containing protein [Bacillota bacterium]